MKKHTVFCDRCGAEIHGYAYTLWREYQRIGFDVTQVSQIPTMRPTGFVTADLCRQCAKELNDWYKHVKGRTDQHE